MQPNLIQLIASQIIGVTFNADSPLFVFLYLGPETIMPAASILAAVIGILLMVWRTLWSFIKRTSKKVYYKITRKPMEEEPVYSEKLEEPQDETANL
jgi:hypothetical protein